MAIARMKKVYIVADKELKDSLPAKLRSLGLLEISKVKKSENPFKDSEEKKQEIEQLEEWLSRINSVIEYLGEVEEDKKPELGLFPKKIAIKEEEFLEWIQNSDWEKICNKSNQIKEKLERLKEEKKDLVNEREFLSPWKNLSTISFEKLKESRFITYQMGIITSEVKETFYKNINELKGSHLHIVKEEGRNVYFFLIYLRENQEKIDSIFQKFKIEKVELEEGREPLNERFKKLKERIRDVEEKIKKYQKELKRVSRERIKLMAFYDHFYNLLQEKKVTTEARFSSYTFTLQGWIREEDLPRLKKGLKDYPSLEIITREPGEDEEVPVALSNSSLFKPFELIVNLYGIPRYFEIDPTPFLAPFFAIFFGFCLTDGGYGLILSLLSFIALKKFKIGGGWKKLFLILFISGLVTMGVGVLTGGIFGISVASLPPSLSFLKRIVLFYPLEEPMVFLMVALGLGLIHILVGIALAFWEDFRRGDIISAFLDHASWILLILGLLIFGASKAGVLEKTIGDIGLVMFIGSAGTLFLFVGRGNKTFIGRIGQGAYELYGIVQTFGDILSYSRLLALGLATSVIATVVNTIAVMVKGIPFIGPILMIVILIGGHLGNIGLNTLSGVIHTLRLQFVEFFGKFYQGGGKSFAPLREERKYIALVK